MLNSDTVLVTFKRTFGYPLLHVMHCRQIWFEVTQKRPVYEPGSCFQTTLLSRAVSHMFTLAIQLLRQQLQEALSGGNIQACLV